MHYHLFDRVRICETTGMQDGYLRIDVVNRENNFPIEGAEVSVSYGNSGQTQEVLRTNLSGQTEEIAVAAPPALLSLEEQNREKPYADYTVEVRAEGYEPVKVKGTEVLAGVLAVQPIRMIPLPAQTGAEENIQIPDHTLYGSYPPKIAEDEVKPVQESGEIVEGKVTEDNKGGIVVSVKGIRVFVPASQSGLPKDAAMSELVGQTVRLKITEVNRGRKRVVGSIRAVAQKERRERAEKIWSEIEVGKHYHGVVKSLTSYGAFVDIGGIDGMVHVSELSWSRIKQPSDVLSVGDEVDVYVISFDAENHKISLGYKDPNGNPWTKFTTTFQVGDVAKVTIVKLMPFGAFAEVLPGVDGLIHISQIANRRIGKPDEVLTVGDIVDAKITAIDEISLSIRALTAPEPAPVRERPAKKPQAPEADALVYEVSATGEATGNIPDIDDDEIDE